MIAWAPALLATTLGLAPDGPLPEGTARPPKPESGKAVEVSVGYHVLEFARVNGRDESFDVTAYLETRWRDPRLALPAGAAPRPKLRHFRAGAIWEPRLFFVNALAQPADHGPPEIDVDPEGDVTKWEVLSGKFSVAMDLQRFPFDTQTLTTRIGSMETLDEVRIIADEKSSGASRYAFVTDWEILRYDAHPELHPYSLDGPDYAQVVFKVEIARRSTYYLWRVMVPLSLLVMASWAAFWFEPVGLQPQISTCLSILLSVVAFNFTVDFANPKVAYLTLIDRHSLLGYVFVLAAVVEVAFVHVAVTREDIPRALAIQRRARLVFPAAYILALAANVAFSMLTTRGVPVPGP